MTPLAAWIVQLRSASLLACAALGACGGADHDDGGAGASSRVGTGANFAPRTAEIEAFAADLDAGRLLALLDARHRRVRRALGPHRLQWAATYSLTPDSPAEGNPEVGKPRTTALAVDDRLELVWDASGDADVDQLRFSLSQHQDAEHGRDVVVEGGRMHVRSPHRPWYWHPLEGEIHEAWLDDAYAAAHDAVEFIAPAVAWRDAGAVTIGERPARRFEAELSAERRHDLVPADVGSAWRSRAKLDAASAAVVLDLETAAWLEVTVEASYRTFTSDGTTVRGTFELTGSLAPAHGGEAAAPEVTAPRGSQPVPERTRLELERVQALEDLAPV
jgi:hypothetical protein